MRRVVVTGTGMISPVGNNMQESWKQIKSGETGVGKITAFDSSAHQVHNAAEVKDFSPTDFMDPKDVKRTTRYIQLALGAAAEALKDSGVQSASNYNPEASGCSFGVGMGGLNFIRSSSLILDQKGPKRVSPFLIPFSIANMAAGMIANSYQLKGPNICTTTACTSSTHAIGEAFLYIKTGMADVMVAGGSENTIEPLSVAGFDNMKALSRNPNPQQASRPFDTDRDGFVMGEGAAALILEEYHFAKARGANILAEVVGYGMSADAHHITAPAPEGEGAQRSMRAALQSAQIQPSQINYINAHGTSTPLNDAFESLAIQKVFGPKSDHLGVSSTKGATGHCLGAAGAVEAAFVVHSIVDQVIPPTAGLKNLDPNCDINCIYGSAKESKIAYALSNSFGFGGTNGSLVFARTA
ncbi:MAG: beta-ketoacyl-ACP synthase II [Zetaproteobacteria bacterium]|nr:beta-ketoacyl-ACP synthase II [Zetaproteobacteria bacterium]